MVNELYLSLVYRPVTGTAPSLLARALTRGGPSRSGANDDEALDTCEKLAQTLLSSLARYEPERLGVYATNGRPIPDCWSS